MGFLPKAMELQNLGKQSSIRIFRLLFMEFWEAALFGCFSVRFKRVEMRYDRVKCDELCGHEC